MRHYKPHIHLVYFTENPLSIFWKMNMGVEIVTGDVLDSTTDALLLTVDGAKRGLDGNIARQFAKRFPEDWVYLQRDLKYPIPIGRAVLVPWDGDCCWRQILFASTLHHLGVLEDHEKLRVIRLALIEALKLCVRSGVSSLSSAVLQGGWRLSNEAALDEMISAYRSAGCPQVRLEIVLPAPAASDQI
jgi:hypothetical protein